MNLLPEHQSVFDDLHRQLRDHWRAGREPSLEVICKGHSAEVFEAFHAEFCLVEELFEQWRQRKNKAQNDGETTIAEICRNYPERIQETLDIYRNIEELLTDDGCDSLCREPRAFQVGEIVLGRYEIRQILNSGGQGIVYKAWDRELQRVVAIKAPGPRAGATGLLRLAQEGRMTAVLEHPHILPIYSFGFDPAESPCFAIKYIQGKASPSGAEQKAQERELKDAIESFHRREPTAIDFDRSAKELDNLLEAFRSVCEAIHFAHEQGYLHRDIKPANIMLGTHGEVWVIDWGLAKRLPESREAETVDASDPAPSTGSRQISMQGSVKGTPNYMSPEQARGDDQQIGPRSDIYNLGATLFELLTGQPPVQPASTDELVKHFEKKQVTSARNIQPHVPRPLDAICQKAINVQPEQRYATAKELANDIKRWSKDNPVGAYPDPLHEKARRWIKRHRTLVTGAAAALLIMVVASTIATILIDAARRRESNAKNELAAANEELAAANKELRRPRYATQFELARALYEAQDFEEASGVLDSMDEDLRGLEWFQLKQFCRKPRQIHFAETGDVAALSPDGSLIAIATSYPIGGDLRVVDAVTGQPIWRVKLGSSIVRAIRFDPAGNRLAVVRRSNSLFSTDMLKSMRDLPPRLSPAKRTEAIIKKSQQIEGNSDTVEVWEARKREKLKTIDRNTFEKEFPNGSAFTAQRLQASAELQLRSEGRPVNELISLAIPGLNTRMLIPNFSPLQQAAVNKDMTLAATAHADGGIRVWSVAATQEIALLPAGSTDVRDLRFQQATDGLVWTGSVPVYGLDGRRKSQAGMAVWTAEIPQPALQRIPPPADWPADDGIPGPARPGDALLVVRSLDGTAFASLQMGGKVRVWESGSGRMKCEIPIELPRFFNVDLALSADGSLLAVSGPVELNSPENPSVRATTDYRIRVFDASNGKRLQTFSDLTHALAFKPGTDVLFACRPKGNVLVSVYARSGEIIETLVPELASTSGKSKLQEVELPPIARPLSVPAADAPLLLAVDPVANRLAVKPATLSGRLDIWDLAERKRATVVHQDAWSQYGLVNNLSFIPDGSAIIIVYPGFAQIRETKTWQVVAILQSPGIADVAVSRDRSRIATAGHDGKVKLWDAKTGTLLWTFIERDVPAVPYWFVTFGKNDLELTAGSSNGIVTWSADPTMLNTKSEVDEDRSVSKTKPEHSNGPTVVADDNTKPAESPEKQTDSASAQSWQRRFSPHLTLDVSNVTKGAKSNNGQLLAIVETADRSSESVDWFMTVFDLKEGKPVFQKNGLGQVLALRFDAEDNRLAAVVEPFADDNEAMLWRRRWELRQAFIGSPVSDIFDSETEIEIPNEVQIVVWSVETGESSGSITVEQFKKQFLEQSENN